MSICLFIDIIIIFLHSHDMLCCREAHEAVNLVYQTSLLNSRPFTHEYALFITFTFTVSDSYIGKWYGVPVIDYGRYSGSILI